MRFTKTLTFERVLSDGLTLQERLLDHINDLPLLSTQTKSYKEVSEVVINQLKTVFEGYVSNSCDQKCQNCGSTNDNQKENIAHQLKAPMNSNLESQSTQQMQSSLKTTIDSKNHQTIDQSNLQQTQELINENDYLKHQVRLLKSQIDEKINESKLMMEQTQTKEMELKELVDMVRNYEDQIRELQSKLEEQILIHQQREEQKQQSQNYEIQAQSEIQQVKLLFQEFVLVKDNIEKQMEELVKKILEKDDNDQSQNQSIVMPSQTTINKFKEGFSNRKIQDIMRCEISEMKELSEVVKDLSSLILKTISEKRSLKVQLQSELDLRSQIEKALENQEVECLSTDLLIMKIKTLEHALNSIQTIFTSQNQVSLNTSESQATSPTKQNTQYLIYQQLRAFNTEIVDEKVRLQEKVRTMERDNAQQREDIESLMARIAECERENVELKLKGDKRIEEEKKKLLEEVEEIRKREEKLEMEIQQKIEEEIVRMQQEQEHELKAKFIKDLGQLFRLTKVEEEANVTQSYDESMKYYAEKVDKQFEKIEILQENKDLMMKERLILEERLQELEYENQITSKRVDTLQQQLESTNYAYQQELQTIREDRDQVNANANLLMSKFRQTASELHEIREQKEVLRQENQDLKEVIEQLERRKYGQSNYLQSQSVGPMSTTKPPLNLVRSEYISSPIGRSTRISESVKLHNSAATKRQPIQVFQQETLHSALRGSEQSDLTTSVPISNTTNAVLRTSLDEKQLSNLIQTYKNENQRFSQKVQELQKKIKSTASLSPLKQDGQNSESKVFTNQRANSSKPVMRNSVLGGQESRIQNKFYFSTINHDDQQSRAQRNSNGFRTLSCSIKKRQ